MRLNKLIEMLDSINFDIEDVEIENLEFDSRKVKPGSAYIALKGSHHDGHNFIAEVEKRGAVAVITEHRVKTHLPQIVVEDTRRAMGELARIFYGDSKRLIKVGITGTNGKTTTAFMIHAILSRAGMSPGLISTIYYLGRDKIKADRTTPESLDLFKSFRHFASEGARAVVMEVSSHALSLKRVDEIRFKVAVFTNLAQDHLDFHKSLEAYKKAKLRIFSLIDDEGWAVVNNDDSVSSDIEALSLNKKITYGVQRRSDVMGEVVEDRAEGLKVKVLFGGNKYPIESRLVGGYNIYNILASFAAGTALGVGRDDIVRGIEDLKSVRGRMEQVTDNVFVDFAHTPMALENALRSLRKYTRARLIVVFGCGGDRDREKRPLMGDAASRLADLAVITSDNPRSEPPGQIIDEIVRGVRGQNYRIVEDRIAAIRFAVTQKQKDDIVLVAGKGHEEYQLIGDQKLPLDDAGVIRECLKNS